MNGQLAPCKRFPATFTAARKSAQPRLYPTLAPLPVVGWFYLPQDKLRNPSVSQTAEGFLSGFSFGDPNGRKSDVGPDEPIPKDRINWVRPDICQRILSG